MKLFNGFFQFEWKRFYKKDNIALVLIFCFLSLFIMAENISRYHTIDQINDDLIELEQSRSRQWTYFPLIGFFTRLKIYPPPASIFFLKSGTYDDLEATISKAPQDTVSYGEHIPGVFFNRNGIAKFDFSKNLFIFGSLLLLFYGAGTFRRHNFYRVVNTYEKLWKIYFYSLLSRYIISFGIFLLLLSLAVAVSLTAGVSFGSLDYLQLLRFSCLWALTSLFFLSLGGFLSYLPRRKPIVVPILIIWLLHITLIPFLFAVVGKILEQPEKTVSEQQSATSKINQLEKLLLLTPGTTYTLMTDKMSGLSHVDLLNFSRYSEQRKAEFTNVGKITDRIYYSVSLMPAHFLRGLLIIALYSLFFLVMGFFLFHRSFYKPTVLGYNKLKPSPFKLAVEASEYQVYGVKEPEAMDYIYSHLLIDGPGSRSFICGNQDLPSDLKVIHLLQFFSAIAGVEDLSRREDCRSMLNRYFKNLKCSEKLVLLKIITNLRISDMYVFFDTACHMNGKNISDFRKFSKDLLGSGRSIVYITTDPEVRSMSAEKSQVIQRSLRWPHIVDYLEQLNQRVL